MSNLKTRLRVTPITDMCREEFQYLYIWKEPYELVDASFLVFGKSRDSTLNNLRLYIYKLWYINPDCSYIEMTNHIVDILNKRVSGGVFISESDISSMVFYIMNSMLPKDISEIVKNKYVNGDSVKTTSRVEWKDSVSGLLVLSDKRMSEIRKSSDIDKEMMKEYRNIKIRYAKKCMDMVNSESNKVLVECTIDEFRSSGESATVKEISDSCGLNIDTVRKYIDLMADRLDSIDGFKVIRNKVKENIDCNINKMIEAKERLIEKNRIITKTNIHRESGVSRPTINKYWNIIK